MEPEEDTLDEAVHRSFNRFRGRLCGFVEALDLPPKQERSIISTLKTKSYDLEKEIGEYL